MISSRLYVPWGPGGERRELRLPPWVSGLLRSQHAHSGGDDGSAGFYCLGVPALANELL